jgi:EmrB/QacA subfamily drug resistance transporter
MNDRSVYPLGKRRTLIVFFGLMLGMLLAALDQTIVSTALPRITRDLGGFEHYSWVFSAYMLGATVTVPLYGKLSDIYGRRPLFLIGITLFSTGSILCGIATSMGMLIAGRAVQGLGAGGLFSLALAIIGDIVPPRERAKYQGYFLAVFGTSSVLGPVIGGFFAGQETILGITGWRWVFLVNVPIAIAALIVVSRTLHLHHTRLDHRIDYWGAVALTVGLVPLLIVAEQGREWGWTSANALICYGIGILGAVAFFVIERAMGEEALLPLRLFQNRTVAVSSIASVFIGMGMFGAIAGLPLYLQIVKGATPTQAGLQLLPFTLGIMFGSILSGQLISRTGRYRQYPIIGAGILTVAMFVFHYIQADTPLWQAMIVMFFFGIGMGFNFQPLTLAVQNAVSPRDIGVATSSATFTRQIGGTLGTAVFLSILFSRAADTIPAAYAAARQSPDFLAALRSPVGDPAANQQFVQGLQAAANGNGAAFSNALSDSSFLQRIDPRLAAPYLEGFSQAVDTVFLVGTFILMAAFIVSWFLPHVELRSGSAYNERNANGAVAAGTEDAQLAPVGVGASAGVEAEGSDGLAYDAHKHNGSGPGGLPTAEDFAVPKNEKRGRHRAAPGEKLY